MKNTNFVISVFIALLFIGSVWLSGCTEQQSNEQSNTGGNSNLISAKEAWNNVKDEISNWDSNYRIARVRTFGTSEDDVYARESNWEFYVESSDGKKSTSFTYYVKKGVSKDPDASFGTGRYTFSPDDWIIDSTQAAQIAMDAIHQNKFPDFDGGFQAELYADENNTPYWEIHYSSQSKNGHIYLDKPLQYGMVKINAKAGEVISVTGYTD
ncbi:MAG: hypothetical protein DRN12_03955 [Thermoplasmata archaeon]|nr:MAG: hypothetical protein DRN12_03955 [Thermoplasmata archaeon]